MAIDHPHLHIGTSGWSYPWQGIFYPLELRSAQYLGYYATRFACTATKNCTIPPIRMKIWNATPL